MAVGFRMGTVRVGPVDTAPVPANTAPTQGTGAYRTRKAAVITQNCGLLETCGASFPRSSKKYLHGISHTATYFSTSEHEWSLFLFLDLTAESKSSICNILWRPQDPRQRYARTEAGESRLRVKWSRWRPCEKTHSTAVEVAVIINSLQHWTQRKTSHNSPGILK